MLLVSSVKMHSLQEKNICSLLCLKKTINLINAFQSNSVLSVISLEIFDFYSSMIPQNMDKQGFF